MPYQISILGAYIPTVLLLCIAGIVVSWVVDRILSRLKVYAYVWHPALFQAGLFAGICAALGLVVYH